MGKFLIVLALAGCQLKTSSNVPGSSSSPSSSSSSSSDDRVSGASSVQVPDVTGLTQAGAESAVRAAGIQGGIRIGNDPGSYNPASAKVCTQTPGGGNMTSSTLFVSIRFCHVDAPSAHQRPELVGMTVEEATRVAKATGFTGKIEVGTLGEYDASCKADTVCRVDPYRWELNQDHILRLYLNRTMSITQPD